MVRRFVRTLAFLLIRVSRRLETSARTLVVATFTRHELDSLGIAEWEDFGEGGPIFGSELFAWEKDFFGAHVRAGDAMLIVGAGSGRDVIPFLSAGHEVTALDITPNALKTLVARAAAIGRGVSTINASIATAELRSRAFDVVSFSWFSYSYLRTRAERVEALRRARSALRAGGRILLSYPPSDVNVTATRSVRGSFVASILGGTRIERGDHYSVSGTASRPGVFYAHFFADGEVEAEAKDAGLLTVFKGAPTHGIRVAVLEAVSTVP